MDGQTTTATNRCIQGTLCRRNIRRQQATVCCRPKLRYRRRDWWILQNMYTRWTMRFSVKAFTQWHLITDDHKLRRKVCELINPQSVGNTVPTSTTQQAHPVLPNFPR